MPTARCGLAAVHFRIDEDPRLYALGGLGTEGPLATVESFDGVQWRSEKSMPTARSYLGAAAFHSRIFVVGGKDGSSAGFLTSVISFDGSSWREEPPMRTPRYQLAVARFDGAL